jgi:hypothetical protein
VLAATLVVAAGTGCSSDDDGTDAAGTTVAATTAAATTAETRPEPPADQGRWARQVDVACKPWQERLAAVPPPANENALESWLAATLPLIRKQVAAVRAIKLPTAPGEAAQAKLFIGGIEKLERDLTSYLAATRAGDAAAMQQALAGANAAGVEARGNATALGITQCGGYEGG